MILNIVDGRTREYRWKRINAIVEATWHDNSVKDTDIAVGPSSLDEVRDDVTYEQLAGVSITEAIAWANAFKCQVTLYLYDDGEGILPELEK